MKATLVVVMAVFAQAVGSAQGFFVFNNHADSEIDARFVLSSDPAGTSSVGTNFQVQLFGGAEGTPVAELKPLSNPSTTFRGPAGSVAAGYVVPVYEVVPGAILRGEVLIRAFDGPSWDSANWRFENVYSTPLGGGLNNPPLLPIGTSPLVLYLVPEPSCLTLWLLGGIACLMRRIAKTDRQGANKAAGGNAGERRSSARCNRSLWAALPGMPQLCR